MAHVLWRPRPISRLWKCLRREATPARSTYSCTALEVAAATPSVVIVSMSYGLTEGQIGNVTSLNSTYLTGNVPLTTVPMTVSTRRQFPIRRSPPRRPTSLAWAAPPCSSLRRRGRYGFETAWGGLAGAGAGGGAACSGTSAAPTYQTANGVNLGSGLRTIP